MATTNTTYNGYTNYETWVVNLWIDSEEGSYNYWRERANEIAQDAEADEYITRRDRAVIDLSDALKDEHDEASVEQVGSAGVFSDLVSAALSEVNWREIAEGMLDSLEFDFDEQGEAEEVEA